MKDVQSESVGALMGCIESYQKTGLVLLADMLDVFSALLEGPKDIATIAERCHMSQRGLRIILDALVVNKILNKTGYNYRMGEGLEAVLKPEGDRYIGPLRKWVMPEVFTDAYFENLKGAVYGRGDRISTASGEYWNERWAGLSRFLRGFKQRDAAWVADFLTKYRKDKDSGTSKFKIVDGGCGPGDFGIELAKRLPNASVVFVDAPDVLKTTAIAVIMANLESRAILHPGNVFRIDLGSTVDVAFVCSLLHWLDWQSAVRLLKKLRDALSPRGLIAIVDAAISDNRTKNREYSDTCLLLLNLGGGDLYTSEEIRAMSEEAGLEVQEQVAIAEGRDMLTVVSLPTKA